MGREEREKRREQKEIEELEKQKKFEAKIWKGHENKLCPECGAVLVMRTFITRGHGTSGGDLVATFAALEGNTFVAQGSKSLVIYFVDCSCGYQKQTHKEFHGYELQRQPGLKDLGMDREEFQVIEIIKSITKEPLSKIHEINRSDPGFTLRNGRIVRLKLKYMTIEDLPDNFDSLANLEELTISKCGLKSLPESLCNFKNLRILDVSDNELDHIPEKFGNLSELTDLNLQNNHISELPLSLWTLPNLEELNLAGNHAELSKNFKNLLLLGKLITLHLGRKEYAYYLPSEIDHLEKLKSFGCKIKIK